jgi:hypothetical protein
VIQLVNQLLNSCVGLMQVIVTAKDMYGNVITAGDAGFMLSSNVLNVLSASSFVRTVAAGVTTFQFSIAVAATYTVRVETATAALVHQSKLQVVPGGLSYLNSRLLNVPTAVPAGSTMIAYVQLRDAHDNIFRDAPAFARFVLTARAQTGADTTVKV